MKTYPVARSRRWQLAWWGSQSVGAVIVAALMSDAWSLRAGAACLVAWFSGFLAAVWVEIATQ